MILVIVLAALLKADCGKVGAWEGSGIAFGRTSYMHASAFISTGLLRRSGFSKTDWMFPYLSFVFDFGTRLVSLPEGMETGPVWLLFMLVEWACRHQLDVEAALQRINAQLRQQASEQFSKLLMESRA